MEANRTRQARGPMAASPAGKMDEGEVWGDGAREWVGWENGGGASPPLSPQPHMPLPTDNAPYGRKKASPEWTTAKAASWRTMAPVLDPPAAASKAAQ